MRDGFNMIRLHDLAGNKAGEIISTEQALKEYEEVKDLDPDDERAGLTFDGEPSFTEPEPFRITKKAIKQRPDLEEAERDFRERCEVGDPTAIAWGEQ